ncbi:MAG: hypothetical protein LCH86_20895 [Proteobacteria bacterium]|nr:hypothetical protein [Pseudomonadota bacterium]
MPGNAETLRISAISAKIDYMRHAITILTIVFTTGVAQSKEKLWIEQAALLPIYRDVCQQPVSDDTILTAIGSAMIEYALPRDIVMARATKRGRHILNDIRTLRTGHTFCAAFMHYLNNGYPR